MRLFLLWLFAAIFSCTSAKKNDSAILNAMIYLDHFDSANLNHDIKSLKEFPYVVDAVFISKEEAKKTYLADGNDDWSEILKENPLPDAYRVKINVNMFSKSDIESFKNTVHEKIKHCSDVVLPEALVRPQ